MCKELIQITKLEKDAIVRAFSNVHIKRTVRQRSKRHHYYCEESKKVLDFLKKYREESCLLH